MKAHNRQWTEIKGLGSHVVLCFDCLSLVCAARNMRLGENFMFLQFVGLHQNLDAEEVCLVDASVYN